MSDEADILAAEYVLGTLPADERAGVVERLSRDADLRHAVHVWQARLSSLDETAPAHTPSQAVWQAIERATSESRDTGEARRSVHPGAAALARGDNVVQLQRRLAVWRGAAILSGAFAAGLAGFVMIDSLSVPIDREGGRYVAVVDTGGREPALIAEVDTASGTIRVRTLNAEVPSGRSLELWHVAEGHEPRSLGILDVGAGPQIIQDVATAAPLEGIIAVSVEPSGGSPSGAPTGPVVYSGQLVPIE